MSDGFVCKLQVKLQPFVQFAVYNECCKAFIIQIQTAIKGIYLNTLEWQAIYAVFKYFKTVFRKFKLLNTFIALFTVVATV